MTGREGAKGWRRRRRWRRWRRWRWWRWETEGGPEGRGEKEVLIRVTGHLPRSLWEPQGGEQTRRGNSNRYAVD